MKSTVILTIAAALVLPLLTGTAHADSATLTLSNEVSGTVTDGLGVTQYEGGPVKLGATTIGRFSAQRRYTTWALGSLDVATLTLTIVVAGDDPPNNIVLHGTYNFTTGLYIGSVGTATGPLAFLAGAQAAGDANAGTLTLTW